jgi:hypothetical protein
MEGHVMRGMRRSTIAAMLIVLGAVFYLAPQGFALNTKPMNVSDLVRESSQIVVGAVSAVRQGIGDNHLPYTEIELKVSESILGTSGTTLTFRQFGLSSPLPAVNGRRYIGLVAGMPQYKVGEHVVLFLGKTSPIGYRTTIGLGQGKFALRGGNLQNEVNNAGLFQNLVFGKKQRLDDKEKSLVATSVGAVGSETFLGFVRRAVHEKWWPAPTPTIKKLTPSVPPSSTLPPSPTAVRGSGHE